MTREEIISGLKFTIEMFLLNPITGETVAEPMNDMDKTTIDACRGAIELLEQEPCDDAVSRQAVLNAIMANSIRENEYNLTSSRIKKAVENLPPVNPQEPKYCDRNICVSNEYNGIGCDECEVTKSQEPKTDYIAHGTDGNLYKLTISNGKEFEQEPCEDAIRRTDVLEAINELNSTTFGQVVSRTVRNLPSVNPQPKTGHWISHREHCEKLGVMPSGLGSYEWCSNCDCGIDVSEWYRNHYNFCPNCGARMFEQESEG